MGKRKERRFAANNTSRRVKLDLFAEPSGDLGGSDVRCDGVEKEQTEPNELPKSPSSSDAGNEQGFCHFIVTGKKTENPLLLLGQYSDEEVEEDSNDKADDATADSSLTNKNEQVDGHKDTNIKSGADTTIQMVDQEQKGDGSCATYFKAEGGSGYVTASNSTAFDGLNKQTYPSAQVSATVSLEQYAPTDVTSQWKMILHEESNQYYYWNTLTGETSWEVPAVLTQTATVYGSGYNESGPMVTDAYNLTSGVEPTYMQQPMENMYTGTDCSTSLTAELGERNKSEDHYAKGLGTDGHQVESQIDSAVNYQPCQEELTGPGVSGHVQATVNQGAATDLPSRLLSQSEGLLEKLRSLKKSHGNFHSNEQISKYILELEVRHSDVKALLNDTSPLVSFWLHTEKELKRLEDSVNDEIYELAKSAVMDGIAETNQSSPKEKFVTDETEDSVEEGELAQSGKTLHSDESAGAGGDGSPTHSQSNPAEQCDNVTHLDVIQKAGSSVVEDVDMDVDMEVEEPVQLSPAKVIDASDGKMSTQTDSSNLNEDVPPPPGEEWVPPPPSEIEDVPPPPPDSFSEPVPPPPSENDHVLPPLGVPYTVPQSYMQQPTDYATQYNLSYPESSYQYITAPNTQFYGQVDGSQVSLPQSAYYYEAVPGTSEVAPVEAYYNLNGVAPLFPVSAEASLNHGGVGSANYNIPSDSSKAVEPSSKSNDAAETASLSTTAQSTDGTGGASVLAKGQSKVKRPKKRTVAATTTSTLRSNKKVSSLVDKWKAAKEELNDSEEEEEDDEYGILDRKRRREIEEWKSRQIASGEAKDNANFQPLGGDWREKVKRRKERAGREGDEPKKKEDKQQKPDLTKLSAHLPSGWQAYWDESTKKTYYGNTITSETSWTRPTTNT